MRTVQSVELKNNQRELLDLAYDGEILLVMRPAKRNVIVLSEEEFNRREKALKNAEYMEMLQQSIKEAESGNIIDYSLEELKSLIDGDQNQ